MAKKWRRSGDHFANNVLPDDKAYAAWWREAGIGIEGGTVSGTWCEICKKKIFRAMREEVVVGGNVYCRSCASTHVEELADRLGEIEAAAGKLVDEPSRQAVCYVLQMVLQNCGTPKCLECGGRGEYSTMDGEGHSYRYFCNDCCGSGRVVLHKQTS